MRIRLNQETELKWQVKKIGVIGPGIVGMPMAALLANARIRIGTDQPAKVIVVQRNSQSSGWKVNAINNGRSVIGGIEPDLDTITYKCVNEKLLSATHDYNELSDADVILIAIQTDKSGMGPDYGPLFEGLTNLAMALQKKPAGNIPLVIFESTLAPSSMATLIKDFFAKYGLNEGKDILLGNSPNRVMPGRLVERVANSSKLIAGLHPATSGMIKEIYRHIVKDGELLETNSLSAEVTKTFENAWRDVRIAFSSEIARICDVYDINFYLLRDAVNNRLSQSDTSSNNPNTVPSGGILIPTIGVGGHCLPKDGILLRWRKRMSGIKTLKSIIIHSRKINDFSPAYCLAQMKRYFGINKGEKITLLGAAYRFNSEDTRNSPTFQLAQLFLQSGFEIKIHDPFVKSNDQNLVRLTLQPYFTNDLHEALKNAAHAVICTPHKPYIEELLTMLKVHEIRNIYDGCNAFNIPSVDGNILNYAGLGKGIRIPDQELEDFAFNSYRVLETGMANELKGICDYLNLNYALDDYNKIDFTQIRRLAGSCSTGCIIPDIGEIKTVPEYHGHTSELVKIAADLSS